MKYLLILTGHTKGLGKAILDRFLSLKDIQIVTISRTSLELRVDRLTEIQMDLNDLANLEVKLPSLFPEGDFDKVILINNAGWIGEVKTVGKLHPKGIRQALNINLLAPMILSDAFVKAYSSLEGKKLICNISSGAAHKPLPGWAEYCSSKAGLAMFSRVAAEELSGLGFRVFSLAPGIIDTEMQTEIRKANLSDFPALDRFAKYKAEGHLSSPEEVAEKVFYLLTNPELFPDVVQDVRNFELP
ncbi:SDR family NAD(P)-dependent oxidoreductase [Algoriphagus boritolerans]|uniref:Benzil reductase ((S)-benzoin forming) n=1 Tax=Algoriphagus boritolerans DSM 17298 = JCM 18970 TaxID=1120964 RepID=A0A1H5WNL0_9BACT|nr:SDR family NAD(P)-dependent oxidoreductase [Algoriphagus boritolerans]SEG01199.1 benzil reductase ((S)-benzoin forming) [Algoriphagus boritolerans DSM 17298 = JCM 18970]